MLEAKLIQVIRTAIKHAHKNFLSQLESFFAHFSLRVEERLWVGWVVRFGGFDCCFLFVVGATRNELVSTLLTLIITPLKTNTQFICGFGYTLLNLLKSFSIIFSLRIVFSRRAVKYTTSYFSSVFSLVAWKSLPLNSTSLQSDLSIE
jgi:hypothetical protein